MKTLKEEVMELLMKRIGVAEDEGFEADYHLSRQKYKFCKGRLFTFGDCGWTVPRNMWDILFAFIIKFEECNFATQAFNPKNSEKYWYVTANGYVKTSYFSSRGTMDCLNVACGNCFRTKVSAEAHKEEILKILKGEGHE